MPEEWLCRACTGKEGGENKLRNVPDPTQLAYDAAKAAIEKNEFYN